MSFTNFPIEINHDGKTHKGNCTIIDLPGNKELPYKFPVYRVSLNTHKIKPDIFLFYKTGAKHRPFFWYKTFGWNPVLWKVISNELKRRAIA